MTKINWSEHISAFHESQQSLAAYCAASGIKQDTLRYHLYKKKPKKTRRPKAFREFQVVTELVIVRDESGALSLKGFGLDQLPQIVGAWSNALS